MQALISMLSSDAPLGPGDQNGFLNPRPKLRAGLPASPWRSLGGGYRRPCGPQTSQQLISPRNLHITQGFLTNI
jgi:hypothetical protein